MTKKERIAHKRFMSKEWYAEFSKWLIEQDPDYVTKEAQLTYSKVTIPKKNEDESYYFDIIFSEEESFNKTFSSVSINELLFAINHPNHHKFVLITKKGNECTVTKSYTYQELFPILDISPFVFKFHFKNYNSVLHDEINASELKYLNYPKQAVKLTGKRLIELMNLFGDYKKNLK
ncbi:MAG: hypothetical protein IKQ48_06015 [Paludibacteraceae bacterium]|nr:hypothetical protein [Paludibacteraceae bacterium]